MHRKELIHRYLHHTHAQQGTHGVGMLRWHVHTRKILMSEILHRTQQNVSRTIYTPSICTGKSSYIDICIIHMRNQALTVWACYGVTCIHEKYWCLKYFKRHAITFLWPYIHTVYAQKRAQKKIFASYTCTTGHSWCGHATMSRTCTKNADVWNTSKDTQQPFYDHIYTQYMHRKELKKRYLHHTHAQQGTHGVGTLRCHVHTRKILMSEILQKTRKSLSMTICRHSICTEKSSKKDICIIHMHNRALTVWARYGVTYIHEKYWCLKYCTRHARTFIRPCIHEVYAQRRAHT
jgi:hypothetical protein